LLLISKLRVGMPFKPKPRSLNTLPPSRQQESHLNRANRAITLLFLYPP